jgi:2-succinyl-5-enolpyruvyl-6-hydroxy-3-cyclohexene-1-carboxylate synthase
MKKEINRNYLWSKLFVEFLFASGIKDVCISPGSRNTPLIVAFSEHKKIRKHVIVDERSSGFFALGLAKASQNPVAIVTTSGTAVAELYPAIIEAYFQKIPLFICTADRPHYLRNSGANQTINQENIYKNHIRFFADPGLPEIKYSKILMMKKLLESAFKTINTESKGPIHFNLPFEKPFEPSNFTDSTNDKILEKIIKDFYPQNRLEMKRHIKIPDNFWRLVSKARKILILSGENFDKEEKLYLLKIAAHLNSPIVAGILSSVRLIGNSHIIKNASSFLRSSKVQKIIEPDLIIQFGYAPTSNAILDFFAKSSAKKIAINIFNEKYDPSLTTDMLIKTSSNEFYKLMKSKLPPKTNNDYLQLLKKIDLQTEKNKIEFLKTNSTLFEWNIYSDLLQNIPANSNLMLSNSLPVRDFDFITSVKKNINIYSNRGASGIDGIISTAAGIFTATKKKTFLVIGDLAFYYDINSLWLLNKYKIPLTIILINNNGGGIFELLPIANEKIEFEKYFKTPMNINFKKIVEAFDGIYSTIFSAAEMVKILKAKQHSDNFSVMEFKVNSVQSKKLRVEFWDKAEKNIHA